MKIPKLLHHIWVGPLPRPAKWMDTWRDMHPDWDYIIWGNKELDGINWLNKRHIARYAAEGKWNGVADLMRYEILSRYGGFLAAADSVCLNPVDELLEDDYELYTISTALKDGYKIIERNIGSVTPLYAASANHWFTNALIRQLNRRERLSPSPVRSTGNRFMQLMIQRHNPEIKIWPQHYFLPEHFNGHKYKGPDTVYATHFWGTTRSTYKQGLY